MHKLSLRKKILYASAIAALGCSVVEVVARVLLPAPLTFRENQARLLQFDSKRAWSLRPNVEDFTVDKPVRINAAGFRDRDFPLERTAHTGRIACIGDSYTYGWGVDLEDCCPKRLERDLGSMEVLNLGVFGYNAKQALETLRGLGVPYRPDLVIYGLYWDDLLPVRPESYKEETFSARMAAAEPSTIKKTLRGSRALYFAVERARALQAALNPARGTFFETHRALLSGNDSLVAGLWGEESRTIAEMRDAAEAAGARLVVAIFPMEPQVLGMAPKCQFTETAGQMCALVGVPSISLLEPLKSIADEGGTPYLPYEQHPTPEGYRRIAKHLAKELNERGLLPRS